MAHLTAPKQLYAHLDALGIAHKTLTHRAVFTVEEGADIKAQLPGGHTKNLFLKDKAGAYFLICALGQTQIALNQLHKILGCARLSFASADAMGEILGVTPGSVTLFALANDTARQVTLILDQALLDAEPVHFHPLTNTATTTISQGDMRRFVAAWGGVVRACDFATGQAAGFAQDGSAHAD
ncbi:MAG: hypothetical protein RL186_271 [Pseudomonadota bacterium]